MSGGETSGIPAEHRERGAVGCDKHVLPAHMRLLRPRSYHTGSGIHTYCWRGAAATGV
jgi:hypothetical protein